MPAKIVIHPDEPIGLIRPELYGHFAEHLGACVDEGIWVGENSRIDNIGGIRRDVVEALCRLHPPVIRWPGGCFADDYHWEDGVGPRKDRPRRVNLWWGKSIETNGFGTHEFIEFCRLIGARPYLAGNLGSGSAREMRDWVEYCNFAGDSTLARRRGGNGSPHPFGVRYWGVGNEAWGCGGNFCPEDYAAEYKRYATYLHDFADAPLFLIACGPDGNKPDWTRRFLTKLGSFPRIHGLAAHYYCGAAGTATDYTTEQWYELIGRALAIESLITEHRAIMDDFDPRRRIGLIIDEWGTWHPPTPGRNPNHLWQQNTLRDALIAAATLDIFNRHADKIVMANIAQMVNVLQAMILIENEKMVTTPTYHVFDLYQSHQGGQSLRMSFEADAISYAAGNQRQNLPGLSGSASLKMGVLTLSIVNPHAMLPMEAAIELRDRGVHEVTMSVLTDSDIAAHNTLAAPHRLQPAATTLQINNEWRHTFPPASVTVFKSRLAM